MALDTGNYIGDFDNVNPPSSDPVSQGDDVLRFIKTCLQRTFPAGTAAYSGSATTTGLGPDRIAQVLIAKATAPVVDTSATGHAARAMGLTWLDTTANLVKMRNQANDAWITLPFDPEVNQKVIALAGTIDGTVIGGATPAAITGTTLTGNTSLALATGATVTGVDNGALGTSATLLATQGAIKTYVDAQVTAQDLDITTDSGTIDIDLDSETLTVAGGAALDTSATGTTVTVNVTDEGITNAKLAHMAANTVKVRDANSTGDPSDVAVGDTELLIGDGAGFATNTLSKDATLLSTGALTVTGIQGKAVSSTAPTDDQMLKYTTSGSGEWQMVSIIGDDKLTTKGDVLTYNTVASETRMGVGTDDYVLMADADASNDNGIDWKQIATASIADNAVTLGKLEDGTQGDILYYGASGAPTRLGFGTSGDVLTTGGTGANPAWATPTTGDITGVTAGTGLSGGGASGAVTLNVEASQTQVTALGTIATGVWNGTAVAAGYVGSGVGKLATGAEWTKTQNFNSRALSFNATQTWDTDTDQVCELTLTANITGFSAPTNQKDGGFYSITLKQDGTGGWTVSWNAVFHFAGGTAPTLTTTASAVDILVFRSDGTNMLEVGRQLDVKTA